MAGTTAINDRGARTSSRYNSLQSRSTGHSQQGLLLKGAYTLSRPRNDDNGEDGWVGLTWNHPLKFEDNFALAVFDRTHVFQIGFVYELPFLKDSEQSAGKLLGGWQLNGIFAASPARRTPLVARTPR